MNSKEYKMNKLQKQLFDELTNYRQHTGEENMQTNIEKYGYVENAKKLVVSDLDVIALINSNENQRISDLVPYTDLTQGAVSKILNRLVRYGFVEKYHQPQNKKDTYLKLTVDGQKVADAHTQYHEHQQAELQAVLAEFSEDDLTKFISLMSQVNNIRSKD
ncbi:MarR family winged helix-turn-helix transcriptional regulator [Weissella cibaria]|uniref:MarR family winged helix-turn-helix transcriptional regulator n=2 Tax=Weissella cibaria TaxID=137591 RepID=UPI000697EF64|nr:winged helix DNA-binding protein [Weissella cibaria]MBD1501240.1 MarR family transcriptional regulator [Weissella cibaria]MCG4286644.1 winged helix DNA-binding protein [Weissella cibaria]MDY2519226.1 winged helix DNA-binding protein [Weissella cibaria]